MKESIRGFLWIQPRPNFKLGRQWSRGKDVSCTIIVLAVPIAIFLFGFIIGRMK